MGKRSLEQGKRHGRANKSQIATVVQPTRTEAPNAAGHRIEAGREARGEAGRIVAPGEVFRASHFEARLLQKSVEIGGAKVIQVAWDIDSIPGGSKDARLPTSEIRDLNDQAARAREQIAGRRQACAGIRKVLEDMEKRNHGKGSETKRIRDQTSARGGKAMTTPGDGTGLSGKVEAYGLNALGSQQAAYQPASAAHVQQAAPGARVAPRAHHKPEMIPHDQPAVLFREAGRGILSRIEPVGVRIVAAKIALIRSRRQTGHAASQAPHYPKTLISDPVKPICALDERLRL